MASRKKAEAVFKILQKRGIPQQQLSRIKAPAGLDIINAHLPEEIAVSILSEMIQKRNTEPQPYIAEKPKIDDMEAIDPICGMSVKIQTAKHRSEYQDQSFCFCCAGCKESFDNESTKYLPAK